MLSCSKDVRTDEKAQYAAAAGAGTLHGVPVKQSSSEKQEAPGEDHAMPSDESLREVEEHESYAGPADERGEAGHDLEAIATSASAAPPFSVFSTAMKRYIIFMSACAGFFSPLSANIYLPALNPIASDLGVTQSAVTLTITTYMIFQGLAPTFMGDLSDVSGRRPVYIIGFVIYICACVGIALQDSFAALLVLRCLQSSGSSSFVALGSGVAADVATSAERGSYMGWVTSGMLLGPAVGPVIGGLLSQYLGWRAIFWFLVILAGIFLVAFLLTFPETGRNVVGNGSIPPQAFNVSVLDYIASRRATKGDDRLQRVDTTSSARLAQEMLAQQRKLRWPNPFKTLKVVMEKDMSLLLLYNSLCFTSFYCVAASVPYLFQKVYRFNELKIGLSFIPMGVGAFIAPMINGYILDRKFRQVAKKAGVVIEKGRTNTMKDFPLEKARVPVAIPLILIADACIVAYGWVMQIETHLAIPLVLLFLFGLTVSSSFNVMSVMLVDNYPTAPATATAANNLCRCLMGAGGTAVIIYMIQGMGCGWCFTFIALVVLATTPILLVLLRWGPRWREERISRADRRHAKT